MADADCYYREHEWLQWSRQQFFNGFRIGEVCHVYTFLSPHVGNLGEVAQLVFSDHEAWFRSSEKVCTDFISCSCGRGDGAVLDGRANQANRDSLLFQPGLQALVRLVSKRKNYSIGCHFLFFLCINVFNYDAVSFDGLQGVSQLPGHIHLPEPGHNIQNVVLVCVCTCFLQHVNEGDFAALVAQEFTCLKTRKTGADHGNRFSGKVLFACKNFLDGVNIASLNARNGLRENSC